jgi:hypothetical protein
MLVVIPEESVEQELARWHGATAQVWMYHASLRRMAIRIFAEPTDPALFLMCLGCASMSGPLMWSGAALSLEDVPGRVDGRGRLLVDRGAPFELRCDSVGMARAPAGFYPASFDEMLSDRDGGSER